MPENNCIICGKPTVNSLCCSNACVGKYNSRARTGIKRPEVGAAISKAKAGIPSPYKGKTYAEIGRVSVSPLKDKTYEEIGRGPSPVKGRRTPDSTREKLSASNVQAVLSGKHQPKDTTRGLTTKNIITGKGGLVRCQSAWEECYALFLDRDETVLSFKKDKVRLPYFYKGKKRAYVVDFVVEFISGKRLLVEVKPSIFTSKEEMPTKVQVAKKWCEENNATFTFVCEEEILRINGGKFPLSFREQTAGNA